jgi:tetratricopeptide (TPR) repeat protein
MYIPGGKHLKPLTLGYKSLAADFLWMKTVIYFGGHYLTDKSYPWLYHILDLVTTLDPYFRFPYEFGGIILSIEEKNVEKSIILMEKGIKYFPNYWRLYAYLGFNYFYYLKDAKTAAHYIKIAATLPNHPKYLPYLAASLMTKGGEKESAILFLREIYRSTKDERIRENILKKIEKIRKEKVSKRLEELLD